MMATVKMLFPPNRKVRIDVGTSLGGSRILEFEPGVQEVPEEFVDHFYLIANGVRPYVEGEYVAPSKPAPLTLQQMKEKLDSVRTDARATNGKLKELRKRFADLKAEESALNSQCQEAQRSAQQLAREDFNFLEESEPDWDERRRLANEQAERFRQLSVTRNELRHRIELLRGEIIATAGQFDHLLTAESNWSDRIAGRTAAMPSVRSRAIGAPV